MEYAVVDLGSQYPEWDEMCDGFTSSLKEQVTASGINSDLFRVPLHKPGSGMRAMKLSQLMVVFGACVEAANKGVNELEISFGIEGEESEGEISGDESEANGAARRNRRQELDELMRDGAPSCKKCCF